MHAKISEILQCLHGEFGLKSRIASLLGGSYVWWKMRMEEKRLAAGWTYEPPTFYEKNYGLNTGKRRFGRDTPKKSTAAIA